MKKYVLIVVALIPLVLFSCKIDLDKNSRKHKEEKTLKGNKNIVKKEFTVSDFDKINISDYNSVIYKQTKDTVLPLVIEIDDNILDQLEVEVKDGELNVRLDDSYTQASKFVVYVSSPKLEKVHLGGAGNFKAEGKVELDKLSLSVSGAGNIIFQDLIVDSVKCSVSGAGSIKLVGHANFSDCKVSGVGSIKASDLVTKESKCNVSGIGSIKVHAEDKLKANVSGVGGIKYKGNPQHVEKKESGVGKIKKI